MTKQPQKRAKITWDHEETSDEDASSRESSTEDESSSSTNSEDSDVTAASSIDDERDMRHGTRRSLTAADIERIADRVSRRAFGTVTPRVVDVMDYDPEPHEAYAQHFIETVCSGSSFNCASIAVAGSALQITVNGTIGCTQEAFDAYKADRLKEGWSNVTLHVASELTLCYNNGARYGRRDQKYLHAEIQQWLNVFDFDDIDYGTNKPCCFFCASIMLAAERQVTSHGKVYAYSLPHALYSLEAVGKRYFGDADFETLRDADDASRRAFEVEFKMKVKSLVRGSVYATAKRTSVNQAYPPPPRADYERGVRKQPSASASSAATSSTSQAHTASTSRRAPPS
ncbi:MAG: hypothetical protein WDZ83_16485 [Rhizobiaceae bacterium]